MLHILLMFLKIIGIILLAILGLLLFSVCIVTFVPVRYRGNASVSGDTDSLKVEARFSWLFHLIYGHVMYEDKKIDWQVRIAWKRVNQEKNESPKKLRRIFAKKTKEDLDAEEDVMHEDAHADHSHTEDSHTEKKAKSSNNKTKLSKKQRFFEKIKYTFRTICDKIKALGKQKEQLQDFLVDEIHKYAWDRLVGELFRLLKFLKPTKLKLRLQFGFEDPSLTGKVLAVLSMLYPFYTRDIDVKPDFENQILEGDAFFKGSVKVLHLAIVLWNLFFDKNVRTTYKEIRNWER